MSKYVFLSPCVFNPVAGGLGDFVVSSAVAPFNVPENLGVIDGKVMRFFAQNSDGTIWERGQGAYTIATHTLARTIIDANSDGLAVKINFASPPEVTVFPSKPAQLEAGGAFPTGTQMMFVQTSAPPGWTKVTTHNDKAIRVVSGATGSGGSIDFSTVFATTVVGNHTLITSEISAHTHPIQANDGIGGIFGGPGPSSGNSAIITSNSTGGGGAHNHPLDLRVKYVDTIIASKD